RAAAPLPAWFGARRRVAASERLTVSLGPPRRLIPQAGRRRRAGSTWVLALEEAEGLQARATPAHRVSQALPAGRAPRAREVRQRLRAGAPGLPPPQEVSVPREAGRRPEPERYPEPGGRPELGGHPELGGRSPSGAREPQTAREL